jgi:hypothetical protein
VNKSAPRPGCELTRRTRWAEAAGLLLLTCAFLLRPALLDPARFIGGEDVDLSHYWFKDYIQTRLRAFELPLWAPQMFSGHPFLAYPEMGLFYPSVLLFAALPVGLAFTLNYVIHIWLAALGARKLLGLFTPSRAAGLTAGIAYAFGGYMASRLSLGHVSYIQSAALLPWLAWSTQRFQQEATFRSLARMAALFALLVLASPPHNAMYALVLMAFQTLVAAWPASPRGQRLRIVGGTSLAVTIGLLVAAVQVVPTLEFAMLTDRTKSSLAFATFSSFPPGNFLRLLLPEVNSAWLIPAPEFATDIGASGILLSLLAVLALGPRRPVLVFLLTAVFSVTLMLGSYTPLYGLYLRVFPPLGVFRIPARAEILLSLCLAVLAGLAVGRASSVPPKRSITVGVCVVALALVMGGLTPGSLGVSGRAAVALALITLAYSRAAARPETWSRAAIPAIVFTELLLAHGPAVPISDRRFLERRVPRVPGPPDASRGASRVFVSAEDRLDRGLVSGHEDANGYAPLVLGRYYRLNLVLSGVTADPMRRHLLPASISLWPRAYLGQILNVRWVMRESGEWLELPDAVVLPRARFVEQTVVEPVPYGQLAWLADPDADPATTAVVDRLPSDLKPTNSLESSGPPPSAQIVHYAPERIEVAVQTERPRLLVLAENAYPGWRASIDGRPAEIVIANYAFRGVGVPAGAHHVTLSYEPVSLRLGATLSLTGLIVLILAWRRPGTRV